MTHANTRFLSLTAAQTERAWLSLKMVPSSETFISTGQDSYEAAPFWTRKRKILAVVLAIILAVLVGAGTYD